MMVSRTAEMAQMSPPHVPFVTVILGSFSAAMETVPVHTFSVTVTRTVLMAQMKILCCVVSLSCFDLLFKVSNADFPPCLRCSLLFCLQLLISVKAISGSVQISDASLNRGSVTVRTTVAIIRTKTPPTALPGRAARDSSNAGMGAASRKPGNVTSMMTVGTTQMNPWRSVVSTFYFP